MTCALAMQRLAACGRPASRAVVYQQWRELLFAHWRYPAEAIQATLPPGLFVDTHEGHAYLGVVWHTPYPLVSANVTSVDETLLTLNGFTPTGRHPDHVCFSPGVDVTIFPMERVAVG